MIFTAFKQLSKFEKKIELLFELRQTQVRKCWAAAKIPNAKTVEQLFDFQRQKNRTPGHLLGFSQTHVKKC